MPAARLGDTAPSRWQERSMAPPLWDTIQSLRLPPRRFRYPGRKRIPTARC